MQQIKMNYFFFVLISVIFLIGCNEAVTDSEKKDKQETATVSEEDNSMPPYNAALDPLTVEAAFANKLADTLGIKMYEITLKPGDTVALHNHPDHSMYVIQGGKLSIAVEGKEAKEFDLKPGMGMVVGPENHNGKNIGNTTVKLLLHDIYRPRSK